MEHEMNREDTREDDRALTFRMRGQYYNTNDLEGEELEDARERCGRQEGIALEAFRHNKRMSPSEVWKRFLYDCPLTSVRRAITNLTKYGFLEKTDDQVKGIHGRPEYIWQYKVKTTEQTELF